MNFLGDGGGESPAQVVHHVHTQELHTTTLSTAESLTCSKEWLFLSFVLSVFRNRLSNLLSACVFPKLNDAVSAILGTVPAPRGAI